MLEILLGASGGVVGILGALVKQGIETYQKSQDIKNQLEVAKEQNAHELKMADKQLEHLKFEAGNNIAIAQLNVQAELEKSAGSVLGASFEYDKATYSSAADSGWMIFIDVVRGLVRPLITIGFGIALITYTLIVWNAVPTNITQNPTFLEATLYKLVDALIFIASTAILWWFAERPTKRL